MNILDHVIAQGNAHSEKEDIKSPVGEGKTPKIGPVLNPLRELDT